MATDTPEAHDLFHAARLGNLPPTRVDLLTVAGRLVLDECVDCGAYGPVTADWKCAECARVPRERVRLR